ncbi:MAG: hypothetical protein WC943_03665, partial [Elusimicrobiota bacterium]
MMKRNGRGPWSPAAAREWRLLETALKAAKPRRLAAARAAARTAVSAPAALNEATDYAQPSSFSRGLRVELPGAALIL